MSASARNIDFTDVKDGGTFNKSRLPAGDYLGKIVKVEDKPANDETPMYLFHIKVKNQVFPYYCKIQQNQLWKLRNILIAAGKTVPKSKMKVDPNSILNKSIGVTIEDADDYKDKEQSEIGGVFPAAELSDDEPDADEVEESDDDELEDDTEDEVEADDDELEDEPEEEGDEWDAITDRLELRKALKRLDPTITTSTKQSDDDIRDLIRAASKGTDDDELEEDVEEEPAPAPKKKVAAAPAKKPAAKKKPAEVSDDELEELDIDDL